MVNVVTFGKCGVNDNEIKKMSNLIEIKTSNNPNIKNKLADEILI